MSYRMSIGGLALAVAAVAATAGSPTARAADLGGNCCSDLEERIAELEATAARKGNRKVSLTVSGWVAQQLMVWDDGVETNAYISDIGSTLNSHVKFSGSAQIATGWTAGYVLHVEFVSNENLGLTQATDNGGRLTDPLQSYWYIKSDKLGKIGVGRQSGAVDNAALLPDGSGTLAFANYILYDVNAFFARRNGALTAVNWGSLATCQSFNGADTLGLGADCDGVPNNVVRYDSPTFAGFSASASWGEDDTWGVSARYAGEFNGIKIAAAIGYYDNSDENGAGAKEAFERARGGKDAAALQIGGYIQHVATGLFVYGAYGKDFNDVTGGLNALNEQQADAENYYIKAGIRRRLTPLGHTVVFGEYGKNDDKLSNALWRAGSTGSSLEQWGVGIVQEIDSAAMSLFAIYRHYEGDITVDAARSIAGINGIVAGNNDFDDADLFKVGALINF